jgi:glutaredoxin-related protein
MPSGRPRLGGGGGTRRVRRSVSRAGRRRRFASWPTLAAVWCGAGTLTGGSWLGAPTGVQRLESALGGMRTADRYSRWPSLHMVFLLGSFLCQSV